jgi:hypothetical protein
MLSSAFQKFYEKDVKNSNLCIDKTVLMCYNKFQSNISIKYLKAMTGTVKPSVCPQRADGW